MQGKTEDTAAAESHYDEKAATEAAEASADWWTEEWLKFPTVSLDDEGQWHYWDVPVDHGVYADDWRKGVSISFLSYSLTLTVQY